jgi:integrase
MLSDEVNKYLRELEKRSPNTTVRQFKSRLKKFTDWVGGDIEVSKVTKGKAQEYIEDVLLQMGRTMKTVQGYISPLHAVFEESVERDHITVNPWTGKSKALRKKQGHRAKRTPKKRGFNEKELTKLFTALEPGTNLWALSVLAAFTGCRGREIAELKLEHVSTDRLLIGQGDYRGKNENSQREVPLHPIIKPLVQHLRETSKDGYLIQGLKAWEGDRYKLSGKRFGSLRDNLELGREVDFHSWRRTFTTRCEVAELMEHTIDTLTGHARQGMSMGTYSDGPEFKQLKAAIKKVSYGTLDGTIKDQIKNL